MGDTAAKWSGAIEVPVSQIESNEWNPNSMSEDMFHKLLAEIKDTGFDEPLIVVPHPEKPGMYRLVNGEHRWKAVQVLEWTHVPVVVKHGLTEGDQKTMTVRRNLLHGDLDRVKFTELVNDVINNHGIPRIDVPDRMGFLNEKDFLSNLVTEKTKQAKEMSDQAKQATQMVDNTSYLLNEIFTKFGETVPQGFLFFMHKAKMHLMVQMDKDMEETMGLLVAQLKASGQNVNDVLTKALVSTLAAPAAAGPSAGPEDVKY